MEQGFTPDFGHIDKAPPTWSAKRPLRIAVLGDFGAGACRGRLQTGAELAKRKPLPVEFDTLEDAMRRVKLSLSLPLGAEGSPVTVDLPDMEAFHPDALYAAVPVFAELAGLRRRLNQPAQFAATSREVMAWAEGAGPRASSLARQAAARGAAPSRSATLDDFSRLVGRPSTRSRADAAAGDLIRGIVAPFVKPASAPGKDALVAAVDAGLSDAMRALLHHADFQTSESLWRGIDFLLHKLETGPQLEVHLFDVSAEELAADLSAVSDLSDTGLYQLLVESPSQEADGGYSYIAGCYHFDATPPHAELLGRAAAVASHAGASLLVGMNVDPFADRRNPPHRLVREAFASLRSLPAASFLGLFGPRFLLRHPYGKKSDPISAFAFEEFSSEGGLRGMLWGHPALLALCVMCRPGATLTIEDLPVHHYTDADGDVVALPCTDRLITANVASLLREAGISALMAHKGEGLAHFNGLEAVNRDGLAAATAPQRRAAAQSRMTMQSKIDAEDKPSQAKWHAASRAEGALGAAQTSSRRPGPAARSDSEPENAATAEETSDDGGGESVEAATEAAPDDGAEPSRAAPAADDASEGTAEAPSAAADDELKQLLASLETPAEQPAADTDEMDPELADLLKSLK
jgi:type VI secretion system protein ImpC